MGPLVPLSSVASCLLVCPGYIFPRESTANIIFIWDLVLSTAFPGVLHLRPTLSGRDSAACPPPTWEKGLGVFMLPKGLTRKKTACRGSLSLDSTPDLQSQAFPSRCTPFCCGAGAQLRQGLGGLLLTLPSPSLLHPSH